jgi:hypothetical protein
MEHSVAINLEDLPKTRATGGAPALAEAGSADAVEVVAAAAAVAAEVVEEAEAAEAAVVVAEAGGDDASWRFGSQEFLPVGSC